MQSFCAYPLKPTSYSLMLQVEIIENKGVVHRGLGITSETYYMIPIRIIYCADTQADLVGIYRQSSIKNFKYYLC